MNLILTTAYSQNICNVEYEQSKDKILIKYDLNDLKFYQTAIISVYVSTDGGETFRGPLTEVNGDVGDNVKQGSNKIVQWEVYKEIPDFEGIVVFDVKARIVENKRISIYGGYNGSNYAPMGFGISVLKKNLGGYLSGRMNSNILKSADYETDGLAVTNYKPNGYYVFNGKKETKRLSITAGIVYLPRPNLGIYLGGGVSQFDLLWGIDEYDYPEILQGNSYVSYDGKSFLGFEAETGMLFQINKIIIGAGASYPNFEWFEGVITVGYRFF